MAGIKIDPEMLDIYMELLNKLMAGSETDGGNARLEVSGAGKTEDGLVRYNEEVNKLGDDLRELYGNEGEILGRIRDGTLFKNADKVSVVARSTDDAGVLAKHADEAAAWLHGGKVFRYSDETAEAVASGEKLLKESGTIYESFADMMSPEDAKRYLDFLENGSREGLTGAELAGVEKADALLVSQKVGYEDVWDLRNAGDLLESGSKGGTSTVQKVLTDNPFDEAGNLKHNIKYQTGEFKYNYETDANGRISNWNTDNLQLTERDGRLNYNSDSLGKIEGDHAGHIAGDRFGGSPELDNIVSQSQNVNLSQYKKIENQWAKAISEGKEVTVNIDIKYDGDGFRPIEFNVEYTIDGDFFSQSILN